MVFSPVVEARARLATLKEAASFLGISMPTMRRRIADGTVGVVRLGPRVIRIHPDELARLTGGSSKVEA